MASRACRSLVRPIKGRLYGTQAAPAHSEAPLSKQAPKLTKLPNGVLVASVETNSPVSQVSIVVNGGSRFEEGQDAGITHCLRVAAGLSTANCTKFGITKNIQQMGGELICSQTREYMYYTIDCTRNHLDTALAYLKDIATAPAFKPWEVSDIQAQLKFDLAHLKTQPHIRVFDLLHKAAFRNTLGNSLYAPDHRVGKYSSEQLLHYVNNYFTSGRIALVGVGVDHDYLTTVGNKLTPFAATGAHRDKAVYHGGEIRESTADNLTYAAVAVEGPSQSSKDFLHAGILQNIMGQGTSIKWGANTTARLGQSTAQATNSPHSVSCVSASYTDGGLFGFYAISQPDDVEKILKVAFEQFGAVTKSGIKDAEFERARNQLKSQVAMLHENRDNVLVNLAEQAQDQQQITSVEDINKAIDAITVDDVVKVAKKMINGKASMAVVGDISRTPYIDELYK